MLHTQMGEPSLYELLGLETASGSNGAAEVLSGNIFARCGFVEMHAKITYY